MPHSPSSLYADVVIVGGSYAGLSAALQLVRARLSVTVIDAGRPRNRFASHAHGVFAMDGLPGADIMSRAREQIDRYPSVARVEGEAVAASRTEDGFIVALEDGRAFQGRRLLLAHGVRDVTPDIPGVAERWGKTALHCPWCHGYEIGGGSIGVLARGPMAGHYALMISNWGEATAFIADDPVLSSEEEQLLRARGVALERTPIAGLEGAGSDLEAAVLADGRRIPIKALFVGSSIEVGSDLASGLGCEFTDTPIGRILAVDALQQTSAPGVFAAGDLSRAAGNITWSITDGMNAGHSIFRSLRLEH